MDKVIKIVQYGLSPAIQLDGRIFVLSIENQAYLLDTLSMLKNQSKGIEGSFGLLQADKVLSFENHFVMITDFTEICFDTKAINQLLTKKFSDFLNSSTQNDLPTISELERLIYNLAESFRTSSGLNIEYESTMSGQAIAKLCGLKIQNSECTILCKLCEYLDLLCSLKPIKVLALCFAKQVLESGQIQQLYKHCVDKEVQLLLIEAKDDTLLMECECRLVVDKDLCVFTRGYSE